VFSVCNWKAHVQIVCYLVNQQNNLKETFKYYTASKADGYMFLSPVFFPLPLFRVESWEVPLEKLAVGMPHINVATALQICVLLSALPAQYLISQWYGADSAQRIRITERLEVSPSLLCLLVRGFSFSSPVTLCPGKLECGWNTLAILT